MIYIVNSKNIQFFGLDVSHSDRDKLPTNRDARAQDDDNSVKNYVTAENVIC